MNAEAHMNSSSQNGSHIETLCTRFRRVEDALTELATTEGLGAPLQREALTIREAFHNRRVAIQRVRVNAG